MVLFGRLIADSFHSSSTTLSVAGPCNSPTVLGRQSGRGGLSLTSSSGKRVRQARRSETNLNKQREMPTRSITNKTNFNSNSQ